MIIFLYGPDSYRSAQKLDEFIKKFQEKRDKSGLSVVKLDGEDLTVDEFRKNVFSSGLFASKRLITIKNLLSKNRDKNLLEEIFNFLKKSSVIENVVIFYENDKPLKNEMSKKIFELLKKQKFSEEFELLDAKHLKNFILNEVKKQGGKITKEAIEFLVEFFGANLWELTSELDKTLAYGQGEVKKEFLDILAEKKHEENIFALIDALILKNKKEAVKLLKNELDAGLSPIQLVGSLAYQFRIIIRLKDLKVLNPYKTAEEFGVHPFVIKKSLPQTKRYNLEQLKKIYQEILKIDTQLKTSTKNPELLFDLLIARL